MSGIADLKTVDEQAAALDAALKPWIAGVRNIPSSDLLEHLTVQEAHDLGWQILKLTALGEAEKKRSQSHPVSVSASSAETAPAENA